LHSDSPRHDLTVLTAFRTATTYSQAGKRLGLAHTTVSRKVRGLERHFGTNLLERSGDRLRLSEAGQRAVEAAERIEEEVAALERGISGHDEWLSGRLELTTVDLLALRYMPSFADFRARYPGVELSIATDVEVKSLSRGEAQVSLRLTNVPEEHLYGKMLERLDFYAFAHRSLHGSPLAALPWLDYRGHPCAARAEGWMRRNASGTRPSAFLSTPLLMLEALRQGLGAGMVPSTMADSHDELIKLSDEPAFSMDVWLLAPKELRRTARVRAFFDSLAAP
jgi:DNA-binding transcriptional LysR family regulator